MELGIILLRKNGLRCVWYIINIYQKYIKGMIYFAFTGIECNKNGILI